jgi:tetratricopeptide (TPR) repeat protein
MLNDLFMWKEQASFIKRAGDPDLTLFTKNAAVIAEICLRLDGLPLALELAAARLTLLSPQALLARLNQRLQVLTGGKRDMPVRQQTLRNTVEWSYNLLDPAEQRLFRRLSVFVGGCTLEGIEAVCAISGQVSNLTDAVLDGVASLIDKSLVLQSVREAGVSRLVMLETLREYAQEALSASGERADIQQAHALYYLQCAEKAAPGLLAAQGQEWLPWLEQEHENLQAAVHWLLVRNEAELAVRLCAALAIFWRLQGYWSQGRILLEQALAVQGKVAVPVRAAALYGLGCLLQLQWDHGQAESRCEESLALYRSLGDMQHIGNPLLLLGLMAWYQGAYARARLLFEESLMSLRTVRDGLNRVYGKENVVGQPFGAVTCEMPFFLQYGDPAGLSMPPCFESGASFPPLVWDRSHP